MTSQTKQNEATERLLHISANQYRGIVLKACVGADIARGIAEDVADAALALLALRVDASPHLIELLSETRISSQRLCWPKEDDLVELPAIAVLQEGPSVIDLVHSGMQVICEPDQPVLLLGLAQARFHSHGCIIEFSVDGGTSWQVKDGLVDAVGLKKGCRLQLKLVAMNSPVQPDTSKLLQPHRTDWLALQKLSEGILVPADDTNRADAGAGLTDND